MSKLSIYWPQETVKIDFKSFLRFLHLLRICFQFTIIMIVSQLTEVTQTLVYSSMFSLSLTVFSLNTNFLFTWPALELTITVPCSTKELKQFQIRHPTTWKNKTMTALAKKTFFLQRLLKQTYCSLTKSYKKSTVLSTIKGHVFAVLFMFCSQLLFAKSEESLQKDSGHSIPIVL